jgi:hypothetical protein
LLVFAGLQLVGLVGAGLALLASGTVVLIVARRSRKASVA